jgi:hypothetical protein
MFTSSRSKLTVLFSILAIMVLGVTASAGAAPASSLTADEAIAQIEGEDGVLRFDIAENATNYAWAGEPALVDGLPATRTAFFTQGYIYPEGTLTESNGVLPDGSPEFPDKVLGQWSCWGWYQGTEAPAGMPTWVTSHLYNFGAAFGEATLVSEGYSIDDFDVPQERAIVGGTGPYAGAGGVQVETNLGFNASNGLNFRQEIRLAGA